MPTPSAVWQVQEAKNRLSEVIDRAQREGPQTITRHGKPVARVVSLEAARAASGSTSSHAAAQEPPNEYQGMGFGEFLLSAPKIEGGLPLPPRRSRKHLPFDDFDEQG
ncbi:MAG: type II toxin-antitoxin system Phd/YefM family antitoxin [Pseudomonadota bacterium]|nr:type II toxin-antitoxin system Phd/YefM family antitoxin [Pseudomonadota bacterium]